MMKHITHMGKTKIARNHMCFVINKTKLFNQPVPSANATVKMSGDVLRLY